MFSTADYEAANEGHYKPYTHGRTKYPQWEWCGGGNWGGRKERSENAWAYTTTAHMRGVFLPLSISHSVSVSPTLPVYVIPTLQYSVIPSRFISVFLSLIPLIFYYLTAVTRVISATHPVTRKYARSTWNEAINTIIKEQNIQTDCDTKSDVMI